MRYLLVIALIAILFEPTAYGQLYPIQTNTADTNSKNLTFPQIAYTQDNRYEVDLTWEPHDILTDKKIIFIFQFYDHETGAIIPNVDYQFVISQNGKELVRIPGTTLESGDYKYFAFDNPGPVTISLEKIADKDLSVSYTPTVYLNPHTTEPVIIVQPPPNMSDKERTIFPILEDAFVGVIIMSLAWIARDRIKSMLAKIDL
ncbi:MAG: hypothetical protein WAN47_11370 [Nitrosotalea sp.]